MSHPRVLPEVNLEGGASFRGTLRVPGDKSISHRALLIAAMAEGTSTLSGLSDGRDVAHTRRVIEQLGAGVTHAGKGAWRIEGGRDLLGEPKEVLDVGNSGTGIRLLAGYLAGLEGLFVLHGDDSVANRPMDRVCVPLRKMGARIDGREGGRLPPLVVRGGRLRGIEYALPVASAQVKGAVLLAGISADGPTTVVERVPTRAHTEEMLAAAGARVEVSADRLRTTLYPGPLRADGIDVPGDPSQAAFWIVAACLTPNSEVTVDHVYLGPGRSEFLNVLLRMGADLTIERDRVIARSSELHGAEVGGHEVPGLIDEIPVLAVAAALADGPTVFCDAAELRVKETDRVATTVELLERFGAKAEARPDGLVVMGGAYLRAATVESRGDHRIAMAGAVAGSVVSGGTTTITGWEAVATSYPGFLDDLHTLTGVAK